MHSHVWEANIKLHHRIGLQKQVVQKCLGYYSAVTNSTLSIYYKMHSYIRVMSNDFRVTVQKCKHDSA